jgi:hypothetical protein
MENKIIVFHKQIHSTCASACSNDAFLSFRVKTNDLDFKLAEDRHIKSKFAQLDNEIVKQITENQFLIEIYLEADKTFYYRNSFMTDSSASEEFKKLVESYIKKGWGKEADYYSRKFSNEKDYLERQLRNYEGYVIPDWNENLTIENYRGALSDEVFNDADLQKYLQNGGCHGYIGHSNRTFATDRRLEIRAFEYGLTPKQLAEFVAHSAGRHFADQLDSVNDVDEYFEKYNIYKT